MGRRGSKVELTGAAGGVRLVLEDEVHRHETTLSLADASQMFLRLGRVMDQAARAHEQAGTSPERRSAIRLSAQTVAIATEQDGSVVLAIALEGFPTLRIPIPEANLRRTGETLLQIADAPAEARRSGKPN